MKEYCVCAHVHSQKPLHNKNEGTNPALYCATIPKKNTYSKVNIANSICVVDIMKQKF